MSRVVIGISAYYHDSAAAVVVDGQVVAAAQEERFTRKKHDPAFPSNALSFVLKNSGIELSEVSVVAFYDKPFLKFERLLETYHAFAPAGLKSFTKSMPLWIKEKLFLRKLLTSELKKVGGSAPEILFPEHHLSHAASAYYPSPFDEAAILTVDGVGEWATTTICHGRASEISVLKELHFPHSLGLLYSAFTYYCGFKVNSGEYKLMGLAPYGLRDSEETRRYEKLITDELIDIREDGSFLLNMDYFNFASGLTMCSDERWERLFGFPRRAAETELTQDHMNLALAVQRVTERVILMLARSARELTGSSNLTMAGGVALNCVANGKLLREKIFDNLWIQPAAGDAGGALGAALSAYHLSADGSRSVTKGRDSMRGSYLGPEFFPPDITAAARRYQAPHTEFKDYGELCKVVAEKLAGGAVVGWFQGRMEYGPRALSNRSILGDPRRPEMQKKLNLKIKYREGFRPFAPSVLAEDIGDYFDLRGDSPYMLIVAPVKDARRNALPGGYDEMELLERLYCERSDIPAVTHVDYSARVQSVSAETNPRYWRLIKAFKEKTGCALVVNTSFNVRGEPVVCTPLDAYRCFMRTEMDLLVIGDYLFDKAEQRPWDDKDEWHSEFALD